MSADFAPAIVALTTLMKDTAKSDDPRRFVIIHCLSRTAQQLHRTLAIRVEDFDDPDRIRAKTNFIKGFSSPDRQVPVPGDLGSEAQDVLEAMTRVILVTLEKDHATRFAEVERLTDTALAFLAAIVPPKPKKRSLEGDDEEGGIGCEDPEGMYVRQMARVVGNMDLPPRRLDRPGDVNELRREMIAVEGTKGQMEAELFQAQIASAEAAELERLSLINRNGAYGEVLAVSERIAQLKDRLVLRTKGSTNAVVSSDVSRGHQLGGEGAGDNHPAGDQGYAERADGAREAPQEVTREAVGMFAMGEA